MKGPALDRALAAPDPVIRCYLFYGPDEAGSRALAARLAMALGDSERIDLSPAQLRSDPALLADEAASVSLFGGARHIRVDGVGDESLAAIDALLTAPVAGNPVMLIAGALRKDAKLLKRVEHDAATLVAASYVPEGAEADRMAMTMARAVGLRIDEEMARRLLDGAGGDRAVLASELAKIALYADADADRPVAASHALIDAVAVSNGEADTGALVDAVFAGDLVGVDREIGRAGEGGEDGVPTVRALLRRATAIAAVRAEIDRGAATKQAVDRAGRSLFWKDRDAVARTVGAWPSARIAAVIVRLTALERALKSARGAGAIEFRHALVGIARAGRGRIR